MTNEQIAIIQELCRNGSGSCFISTIADELHCNVNQLLEMLLDAPFDYRIGRNINGVRLLVLDSNISFT